MKAVAGILLPSLLKPLQLQQPPTQLLLLAFWNQEDECALHIFKAFLALKRCDCRCCKWLLEQQEVTIS